jgi:predicted ATPase/class 3 adenylate cyclase
VAELPSGTVTFLFTDLEVSTRLWEQEPEAMRGALARHDAILRDAVAAHGGHVVKGTGDGIHAAFATADAAVHAAIDAQLAVGAERWGVSEPLRVRMGIHTGVAELRDGDYFGPSVNRAARLMSAAHGGQAVVSLATEELVRDASRAGTELLDLGEHRLRDLGRPERVFQIAHPGLPRDFPPLRSLEHPPGTLPVFLTSFVGRRRELESVRDALRQSRIVTLIGVGGVGKTRLAVQVAAEALADYPDGAWFCELAPVIDRRAVPEAVAACLDVRVQPGESRTESLLTFLRDKRLLLVLDNCEHVIDAAGSLGESIARGCPHIGLIATSREALGVDGELLRPLGSLEVPDEQSPPADLLGSASVRLFADRAQTVRPEFALDEASAPVVAEICRQLDGVPLAIELAAARVASLSVNEIAQRLDQRFRLLTGGRRTALERHQTLRGAVDWSYELLEKSEARAFNRLAVFAGGFTLDGTEAVVSDDGIDASDVLDVLSRLVARSMVVADESEGTTRYRLHETMRQYARERLDDAGEGDVVRGRHAVYYVAFAEAAQAGSLGRDEERWVRTVDREFANFAAALDWSIGVGDADLALRLVVALGAFGVPRPRYSVGRWLGQALDMPAARHHPLRPYAETWATHSELALSGDVGALVERGRMMDSAFEEAGLELTVEAHGAHAMIASQTAGLDEAIAHATAAAELAVATDDPRAAFYNASLALYLAMSGDTDGAVRRGERAVALASARGIRSQLAPAENALGYALSTVDPERAIPHLEAAWSMSDDMGNEVLPHVCGTCLARLLATRGDLMRAFELHSVLLTRAAATGARVFGALDCESLAVVLANSGYPDVAATLFGALDASSTFRTNRLLDRRPMQEALRRGMGEGIYEDFAARGGSMDADNLVAFARAELTRIITELSSR